MKTNPKISIIIPVYNVEKWLERAAQSLKDQTFDDFEVWLVDDGSTDQSGKICDSIASQDSRFNVIHKKNGGAAEARNAAFEHAKGKYLYFMDPDDWAEKTMLQDMFDAADTNNLELLVTGYFIDTYYTDTEYYQEKRNAPDIIYTSQEEFRKNSYKLFDEQLLYSPWNKLYLADYIFSKNIKYPDTFWDDLPFNLDVVRDIQKVGCFDGHYYHFLRARAEAENTKYRPNMYEKREEENQWMRDLYSYWGCMSEEIDEFLSRRYSERLIGCVENVTNKNCNLSRSDKRAEIKKMISTPHARDSFKKTKPKSSMMKIMLLPYKWQNVFLVMAESKFITFIKSHNTNLFARLKANR